MSSNSDQFVRGSRAPEAARVQTKATSPFHCAAGEAPRLTDTLPTVVAFVLALCRIGVVGSNPFAISVRAYAAEFGTVALPVSESNVTTTVSVTVGMYQ